MKRVFTDWEYKNIHNTSYTIWNIRWAFIGRIVYTQRILSWILGLWTLFSYAFTTHKKDTGVVLLKIYIQYIAIISFFGKQWCLCICMNVKKDMFLCVSTHQARSKIVCCRNKKKLVDLEQLLFFIKTPCKLTRLGSIKS